MTGTNTTSLNIQYLTSSVKWVLGQYKTSSNDQTLHIWTSFCSRNDERTKSHYVPTTAVWNHTRRQWSQNNSRSSWLSHGCLFLEESPGASVQASYEIFNILLAWQRTARLDAILVSYFASVTMSLISLAMGCDLLSSGNRTTKTS